MLRMQSPILPGDRCIINSTKLAALHHTSPPPPPLTPSSLLPRLESDDMLPLSPAPLDNNSSSSSSSSSSRSGPFVCLCGFSSEKEENSSRGGSDRNEEVPALSVYEVRVSKRNKKKGDDMLKYEMCVLVRRMTFADLVCSVQDIRNNRRKFVGWLPLSVATDCNARTLWTMTSMRFADFSELGDVKWATFVLLSGLTDAVVHKLLDKPTTDAAHAFIALNRLLYQTYEQDQHIIDLCKENIALFESAESQGAAGHHSTAAYTGLSLGLYVVCRSVTDCEWARIADFVCQQTFRLLPKSNAKKALSSKQIFDSVFASCRDDMKFVDPPRSHAHHSTFPHSLCQQSPGAPRAALREGSAHQDV